MDRELMQPARREVGRTAREAWTALRDALHTFAQAKSGDPSASRARRDACSRALAAVDRLAAALQGMRATFDRESRSSLVDADDLEGLEARR